ncbi:ribosomal protein L34 [Pseudoscourfieldia marina]
MRPTVAHACASRVTRTADAYAPPLPTPPAAPTALRAATSAASNAVTLGTRTVVSFEAFARTFGWSRGMRRRTTRRSRTTPPSDMTRIFRKLVGMLLYLAYWSRPDLAQAVRTAAQGMAAPTEHHLAAATRALGYLRAHPHRPLVYGRIASPANVRVFVDADHAGSPDRKSISGMAMLLDGQGAFAWRSSKQHLVATSSTEAELIALADNCSTISVVRRVLGELGLLAAGPTTIMEDNMSAITIIRDIVYNGRTKHIDVRLKNLRDHVKRKALELQHIDTKEQIADIFTKGLGREAFDRLSERLMGEPHLHSLQTVAREE